jgi:tripartite-type tricarboxylate transporter receptor subunit TctC
MKTIQHVLAAALVAAAAPFAQAADYPSKQITLIVGAPPGGPFDLTARLLGDKLKDRFNQPVVIENRPGVAGQVAFEAINKAPPDGYTIAMGATGLIILKFMLKSYTIDPVDGYTHIVNISGAPLVLTVNAAQPYKTLAEFLSYAKANPGKVNFGTLGGALDLDIGIFQSLTGTKLTTVQYKGTAAQQQAVATGEVGAAFDNFLAAKPFVEAGKTRVLAVVHSKRFPMFGDIPAIGEQVPNFEGTVNWFSVIGPPKMPREIVTTLNQALNAVIQSPDLKKRLNDGGQEVLGGTPEALRTLVARETERMTRAAKLVGMQPQ